MEGVSDRRQDVAGVEQIHSGRQEGRGYRRERRVSSHRHERGLMVDSFLAGRRLNRIVF